MTAVTAVTNGVANVTRRKITSRLLWRPIVCYSKMPLFGIGNRFSPKKAPLRKNSSNLGSEELEDLVLNQRVVQLRLGDNELTFENGEWIPESGQSGSTHKSNQKLRKKVQELQEENNMLRLKYAIMLNMLTQTTAESHLQERELEKLKSKNK